MSMKKEEVKVLLENAAPCKYFQNWDTLLWAIKWWSRYWFSKYSYEGNQPRLRWNPSSNYTPEEQRSSESWWFPGWVFNGWIQSAVKEHASVPLHSLAYCLKDQRIELTSAGYTADLVDMRKVLENTSEKRTDTHQNCGNFKAKHKALPQAVWSSPLSEPYNFFNLELEQLI